MGLLLLGLSKGSRLRHRERAAEAGARRRRLGRGAVALLGLGVEILLNFSWVFARKRNPPPRSGAIAQRRRRSELRRALAAQHLFGRPPHEALQAATERRCKETARNISDAPLRSAGRRRAPLPPARYSGERLCGGLTLLGRRLVVSNPREKTPPVEAACFAASQGGRRLLRVRAFRGELLLQQLRLRLRLRSVATPRDSPP